MYPQKVRDPFLPPRSLYPSIVGVYGRPRRRLTWPDNVYTNIRGMNKVYKTEEVNSADLEEGEGVFDSRCGIPSSHAPVSLLLLLHSPFHFALLWLLAPFVHTVNEAKKQRKDTFEEARKKTLIRCWKGF